MTNGGAKPTYMTESGKPKRKVAKKKPKKVSGKTKYAGVVVVRDWKQLKSKKWSCYISVKDDKKKKAIFITKPHKAMIDAGCEASIWITENKCKLFGLS